MISEEAVGAALYARSTFKNQRGRDNEANLMRAILEAARPHMLARPRPERDEFAEAIAAADRLHKEDPVDPTVHYSYVIADELLAAGYRRPTP